MPENSFLSDEIRNHIQAMEEYNLSLLNSQEIGRNYSLADYTYELIMDEIRTFEDNLDDDHEVAVKLTSFGQSVTMAVTEIGYANPSTLFFYGLVGDQQATLIQHVSQLNFLLLAVPKADPEKPARRIGFALPDED